MLLVDAHQIQMREERGAFHLLSRSCAAETKPRYYYCRHTITQRKKNVALSFWLTRSDSIQESTRKLCDTACDQAIRWAHSRLPERS